MTFTIDMAEKQRLGVEEFKLHIPDPGQSPVFVSLDLRIKWTGGDAEEVRDRVAAGGGTGTADLAEAVRVAIRDLVIGPITDYAAARRPRKVAS